MPQTIRVLRCYNCETFQSDIVKKSLSWTCKICNEKQSLIKVFFIGSGKECRLFVQEMNKQRVENCGVTEQAGDWKRNDNIVNPQFCNTENKWDQFLPKNTDTDSSSNSGFEDFGENLKVMSNQSVDEDQDDPKCSYNTLNPTLKKRKLSEDDDENCCNRPEKVLIKNCLNLTEEKKEIHSEERVEKCNKIDTTEKEFSEICSKDLNVFNFFNNLSENENLNLEI